MEADIDEKGRVILHRKDMKSSNAFCPFANSDSFKYCSCKCPKLKICLSTINVCGTSIKRKK